MEKFAKSNLMIAYKKKEPIGKYEGVECYSCPKRDLYWNGRDCYYVVYDDNNFFVRDGKAYAMANEAGYLKFINVMDYLGEEEKKEEEVVKEIDDYFNKLAKEIDDILKKTEQENW
jgi:hypothetical protein